MQYRHELKHDITTSDMIAIRQRMRAIAEPDSHAVDGKYLIRSLYFDTPTDKALFEKRVNVVHRRHLVWEGASCAGMIRLYSCSRKIIRSQMKSIP